MVDSGPVEPRMNNQIGEQFVWQLEPACWALIAGDQGRYLHRAEVGFSAFGFGGVLAGGAR